MAVWKYRLSHDITDQGLVWLNKYLTEPVVFRDDQGIIRLIINPDGSIIVKKDYAWDGCSPKFKLFGWLLVGTPDGAPNPSTGYPYTYFASCIHDALCQFEDHPDMPFSRSQIDYIFYQRLVRDEFPAALLYYKALRIFGGLYKRLQRLSR